MNFTLPVLHVMRDWITEHPYQAAMHAANAVIVYTPAAVTVPIFSALGFSTIGPAAGTFLS
jgi:hypothetical protein